MRVINFLKLQNKFLHAEAAQILFAHSRMNKNCCEKCTSPDTKTSYINVNANSTVCKDKPCIDMSYNE
jgi:hypothetical protein